MSRSVIAANPEALLAVQPAVHELADGIDRIARGLAAALEADGGCWGSDEWGAAFAASYLPASTAVRSLLDATVEGIENLATVVGVVAETFAAADQAAGRSVS
jgi:hypothetical protein